MGGLQLKNNMGVFMVVIALIGMLGQIEAQTRHTVGGDSLGWNVPPATAGAAAYSTWASTQTFTVGDVLVFNFPTNIHNVAEVTQAAFNSCNSTAPISLATTGPATVTLTTAGTHYFICGVGQHCSLGQQLAINVSAVSSSPPPAAAPQPPTTATPPPASTSTPPAPTPTPTPTPSASPATPPAQTPAPTPERSPATHVVGGRNGWTVPNNGAAVYQTWARSQTFVVGDVLVFNFINGTHNVAELSRAAYESCNTTTNLSLTTTSPARITLATAGEHFFTCTFPQHCSSGQQLAINVTGTSTAAPSSPPTTPSSDTTPSGGVGAPPPPSGSAPPSFALAALPITFLSVALAFLF